MNVPIGERGVEISASTINHWVTVALGIIVGLIGWSYQVQQQQLDRLQVAYNAILQTEAGYNALWKAHEESDFRSIGILDGVSKKQIEVLTRISVLETTSASVSGNFGGINATLHDLSGRIDIVNDRLNEIQRQTSAIEGKLGESLPDVKPVRPH
jgi:hypothetical protein